MTDIRELSIDELDTVSGGMDCKSAQAVANVYWCTAVALAGLGNKEEAGINAGIAIGLGKGCTP
jgi:bacteriocin-like protein